MNNDKTYSLSIYLHKTSVANYDDCINIEALVEDRLRLYAIDRNKIGTNGKIFVSNSEPHPPDWQVYINKFANENVILEESTTNRAVIVLKIGSRFMSITFGHGKYMLNENTIVRDFGIKVAASLIDSEKIRSLSTLNIEDVILNIQRQSSIYSNKENLQIDTYKDILKEVAGSPHRRQGVGAPKILVGTDSLKATKRMNLEDIVDDLRYYRDIYNTENYMSNGFGWLDNIQRVKDSQLLGELDSLLENSIRQNVGDLHIAANRPIDWSVLKGFLISGIGKRKETDNFFLDGNKFRKIFWKNIFTLLMKMYLLI